MLYISNEYANMACFLFVAYFFANHHSLLCHQCISDNRGRRSGITTIMRTTYSNNDITNSTTRKETTASTIAKTFLQWKFWVYRRVIPSSVYFRSANLPLVLLNRDKCCQTALSNTIHNISCISWSSKSSSFLPGIFKCPTQPFEWGFHMRAWVSSLQHFLLSISLNQDWIFGFGETINISISWCRIKFVVNKHCKSSQVLQIDNKYIKCFPHVHDH